MNLITVKELMVPVSKYPIITPETTILEAESILSSIQISGQKLNSAIVFDDDKITGKINYIDILQGLDPRYGTFGDFRKLSRFGFSPSFYEHIVTDMDLLTKPLDDLCKRAAQMHVKDIMDTIDFNLCIKPEETINAAIHYFIITRKQSLFVAKETEILGMLELSAITNEVGENIRACRN
jgi:CBS domain-containing protein